MDSQPNDGRELMKLESFLDDYFLHTQIRESTKTQYRNAIRLLQKFVGRELLLTELNDKLVSQWLIEYAKSVKPYTVKTRRSAVIAIWNAAYDAGLVELKPDRVRRIRTPETVKDVWAHGDVAKLVAAAGNLKGRFRRTCVVKSFYFRALVMVAWDSGLRLGDIVRIKSEWIKHDNVFSIIQAKSGRQRVVILNKETQRACLLSLDQFSGRRELVFEPWREGTHRNQLRAISDFCREIMKAAKLDATDSMLKKLRRSSITAAEQLQPGTGWIQGGHAGPDVTVRHYINQAQAYQARPIPLPLPTV